MNITLLAGPVIGGVIGYCTNYIAVKMLFRPFTPKYILGHQIPFTPGMIPKRQPRIADAIGRAVGETLLTKETLQSTLLSDERKEAVRCRANQLMEQKKSQDKSLADITSDYLTEAEKESLLVRGKTQMTEYLMEKLIAFNVGELIVQQAYQAVQEKLAGSFFGSMIPPEMIQSMIGGVGDRINQEIEVKGPERLYEEIEKECEKLENMPLSKGVDWFEETSIDFGELVVRVYTSVVEKHLAGMVEALDVTTIVSDQVKGMNPRELEQLVLSVAKKELRAIVNLGALIGFVLGCLNLLTLLK